MLKKFRWIEDVETWLEPMGYEQFWREIRPYRLVMYTRTECDEQIANGTARFDDVLFGVKVVACHLLTRRHQLKHKPSAPWLKVVTAQEE